MNRRDLINAVGHEQAEGLTMAAAGRVVEMTISKINEALLAGEKVSLAGFGVFEVRGRKGRTCRNPQTGEAVQVRPSKGVHFKAAKRLKDDLNGRQQR